MAGQGQQEEDKGFVIGAALARADLFGDFRVYAPDGAEVALPNRRGRALLAMLCVEPDHPIARDTLIRLLWPGRFEAQARASLRQCLLDLGKTLDASGCGPLCVTRERIGLVARQVRTDLGELEHALAAGDVEQVNAVVNTIGTRKLLDDLHFGDGFAEWLKARRDEIEHRIGSAVAEAVDRLQRAGKDATAERLRDAWAVRNQRPHAVVTRDERTRVAVLPFQIYGSAESADYFIDGIADELISSLGQVPQLRVTGRTSSFHFRDSDLALPAIADALQVSHVIEGSVQRQGEAVRVHVHLIDGTSGFELWGDRYDGTLDAIFRLQEDIAQAVTHALADALGLTMAKPLVRDMTHSRAAYDLYLQARSLSFRLFADGALATAVTLLEEAVALDPDFAEAWLLKAEVHQLIAIYLTCLDRPAEAARMTDSVERALAIKPVLGQAYSLLGLHQLTKNDFVGALDLAFKGHRLDPNNPQVAMRLGSYLMFCGRTVDGLRHIEEALAQDPIDGRKFMLRGVGRFNRGDLPGALADFQRSVDLGFASVYLGVATAAAGQHELAVEQYMQTRLLLNKSISPPAGTTPMTPEVMDAYWLVAAKGVCSGKAEDRETYCRTLDYLHMTMHDNADYAITLPAVFMGYTEMLYKTIGQRVSPANMGSLMSIWADIEPIRQIWRDPEFIPFAQRIGMAAAWDKYGWPDLLPVPDNRI